MTSLEQALATPKRWLVTGAAGFIGSNLCEALIQHGHHVIGLDNFSTGRRANIADLNQASLEGPGHFTFIEGDIRSYDTCAMASKGVHFVLHQAALGSVPRSINDPIASHDSNVNGFVNMLRAAQLNAVERFVFASSSSVYGDHPDLPKVESKVGKPLSPYAATKSINELYAATFQRTYGIQCIGLRYFNVFGRRQDPNGPYAAVIPLWVNALLNHQALKINGDGTTSRDFCYIDNVIQANLRAALLSQPSASSQIYNVACGDQTTLLELARALAASVAKASGAATPSSDPKIDYLPFRAGDVKHSLASIDSIQAALGYSPSHNLKQGLDLACDWYVKNQGRLKI